MNDGNQQRGSQSNGKPYCIFESVAESPPWVEVGCTSWYKETEIDSVVMWPPVGETDYNGLAKYMRKPNQLPGPDWRSIPARLRRSFATYAEAKLRLPEAINNSNITTTEIEDEETGSGRPHRKVFPNRKFCTMDLDYGSKAVAAKKSKKTRLVSSDEEIELEENDAPTPPPFNAEETAVLEFDKKSGEHNVGCMSRENFDRKRTNSERIISSNAEQKISSTPSNRSDYRSHNKENVVKRSQYMSSTMGSSSTVSSFSKRGSSSGGVPVLAIEGSPSMIDYNENQFDNGNPTDESSPCYSRNKSHQDFVKRKLLGLSYSSQDQDRFAQIVSHQMADIKSQLSALVKRDLEEDDAEDFELPITNASDLEKVNSAISTSKKAYKVLFRQLDSVGGRGPSHIVNEMMRKLLHRETLAKTMTWCGQRGNVNFSTMPVAKLLLDVCRKKTPVIQEMDVKKHGGSWLLHCKDTKKTTASAKPSDTVVRTNTASRKNDCVSTSAWKPDEEDLV